MDHLDAFYDVMLACGMKPPPRQEWMAYARINADLWPIVREGKFIGGIFFKGHTIHIAVLPEWHRRWVTKSILRAFKEGWQHDVKIYAAPEKSNTEAIAFIRRLGFKYECSEDNQEVYFKEPTCRPQSLPL